MRKGYAARSPMYGRADEIPQNVVDSLRAEAVEMAKKADLVVLVGGLNKNHFQDCEAATVWNTACLSGRMN